MLKAEAIKKTYGSLKVLKGVDLHVKKGEIVVIVGASGAGKSTLLHILGTLDSPESGSVYIKDKNVFTQSASSLAQFRNQNIGFVFQFHNLLPEFTALENVMIPGLISGRDEKAVRSKAESLMDKLGILARKNHKPSEMSGGEQQRTSVARALINEPSIVFADEPSGNLDSANAAELHKLFLKLREEMGYTFVIVTHNLEFANMADRKIEIRDGMIM